MTSITQLKTLISQLQKSVNDVEYETLGGKVFVDLIKTCETKDNWEALKDIFINRLQCPYLLRQKEKTDVVIEEIVETVEKKKQQEEKEEESKEESKEEIQEKPTVVVPKRSNGGVCFDEEGEKRLFEECVEDGKCKCMVGQRIRSKRPMDLFSFKVHYKNSKHHGKWWEDRQGAFKGKTQVQE